LKNADQLTDLLGEEIDQTVQYLQNGKLILCATDTIWGISCDAFNKEAYDHLSSIKNRKNNRPFVLLVSDIEMLKRYIKAPPPRIENLLVYHKRPITLVYKNSSLIPEHCVAQDDSVAIRIPKEPFIRQVIHRLDRPIASTSANISGAPYPKHFGEISSYICNNVDYISKYGRDLSIGKPSPIFSFDEEGQLLIIRE